MDNETYLFGIKKKKDWVSVRKRISSSFNEPRNWKTATSLLNARLRTRYFVPIKGILSMRDKKGEGFAAMALVCSLIEFLHSCYLGESYQYKQKGVAKKKYHYLESGPVFKAFLKTHAPFSAIFSLPVPHGYKYTGYEDDFYSNVRCGLLHEAATKNNWIIVFDAQKKAAIADLSHSKGKVIYRDGFVKALEVYCKSYLINVVKNGSDINGKLLRHNFCRKMDMLCEIPPDGEVWWNV